MSIETLPNLPLHQRWRQQAFPAPAVVAIVQRSLTATPKSKEPRYLLIKRNVKPYAGQWALVGGKWEFGETLADAIVREVKEESDLEATFIALRGLVSERVMPHKPGDQAAHFLIFVCDLMASGKAVEQEEGAVRWFTLDEIQGLRSTDAIIPSDFEMINSFVVETAETAPYIEAEMKAPLESTTGESIQLLRFERILGPVND